MVISAARTVPQYLAELPSERRAIVQAVREVVLANLDPAYEEGIQYGMIAWYVPHRVFPAGYHCDPTKPLSFAGIAAHKNGYSLYLAGAYCGCAGEGETPEARWFRRAWLATGKRLDMGKACVRFKRLEDVPLAVVGEAIRRIPAAAYVERYLAALAAHGPARTRRASGARTRRTAARSRK